jgi:predicted PurR-regulated permease PerM
VLGIVLVFSIPVVLVPRIVSEAYQLVEGAKSVQVQPEPDPEVEQEEQPLPAWVDKALSALPLEDFIRQMGWGDAQNKSEVRAILAERVGQGVLDFVKAYAGQFLQAGRTTGMTIAQFFGAIGRAIVGSLIFLGNFALFAFVAGYLLRDFDGLVATAKGLIPPRYRAKTVDIFGTIDMQVRGFVRGQLTVCVCLGVLYAIGLLVSGTPFAIPIALFGAVASFVPYLGPILTLIPALLLTLLRYGVDWQIVSVVVALALAQAIEGNILTPKIVGDNVGLSEVWVILAILVFGSALGFLGMLLALPMAAALKVLVLEAVDYYRRSPVFEEVEASGGGGVSEGDVPPGDSSG